MEAMTHLLVSPLALGIGPTELIIIFAVLVLLFGAKKLPELARGSGRALRIFKAETKGLMDDDEENDTKTLEQREINERNGTVDGGEPHVRPRSDDPGAPGSR